MRKVQERTPYTPETRDAWEAALIAAVVAYIDFMVGRVRPTAAVYIAVDGVAPMAKIKQQRMRRFKSARTAEEEARIRRGCTVAITTTPITAHWDRNAITPGTKFMSDLAQALHAYARAAPTTTLVSSADEAGEGEQKIMQYLRHTRPASTVIYGLDADLIVLGLLLGAEGIRNVDLFREQMEFGGAGDIKTDVFGDNEFLYMSIDALGAHLHNVYRKTATQSYEEFVTDFVGLMSLLGNDFVPHGMTLKIRDEGIEHVLDLYRSVVTQPLLQSIERPLRYNAAALHEIFAALSRDEPARLLKTVCGKLLARPNYMHMKSEEERALARYNDRPLLWGAERCMVVRMAVEGYEHPRFVLRDNWRDVYDKHAPPSTAVPAYLQSLSWTLAYYAGEAVDMHWYYPWFLPPRFEALAAAGDGSLDPPAASAGRALLRPLEQLTMVLPRESFHLLPAEFGTLLTRYPYFWPTDWELYSFGRRYLWECEPLIPLVQPGRITAMIEEAYEA